LLAKALADCRSGQLIGKYGFGALVLVQMILQKRIAATAGGRIVKRKPEVIADEIRRMEKRFLDLMKRVLA